MWKWIVENNGTLAFFLSLLTAACGLYHYISIKRSEERARRFASFHELVDALNGNDKGDAPFIDRQIAVVYEMRNFPEYYPVTLRILERSLLSWSEQKNRDGLHAAITRSKSPINTLSDEARLTIKYIKRRQLETSYLCIPEEDRL
jgi:hypothetical protein